LRSAKSQTLSILSSEPDKSSLPSHEIATDLTGAEWLLMSCEYPSTELFQTLIV
jgi:hypothetical protein